MLARFNPSTDLPALLNYLHALSPATQSRFGPHAFNAEAISSLYAHPAYRGYLAWDDQGGIIAYAVVKIGILDHEKPRLESYGLQTHPFFDATFAPSVADAWQGRGLGPRLYEYVEADLQNQGVRRIFLWGGVQQSNERAVRFYEKNGFQVLGEFEYQGMNWDMMKS
jgi:diamine N-acetyltransferase